MTPEQRAAARARCEACEPMPTEYGPVDCCTTLTFALDEIDRLEAENEQQRRYEVVWNEVAAATAAKHDTAMLAAQRAALEGRD